MAVYVENRNQRNNQESAGKAKNSLNPSEAKTTISHLKTFRRVLLGFIPIFILSILNWNYISDADSVSLVISVQLLPQNFPWFLY